MRRAAPLLVLFVLLASADTGAEPATIKAKKGKWESFLLCPLGSTNRFEPGKALRFGTREVVLTLEKKGARVTWTGGPRAGNALISSRKPSKTLKMGSGRDTVALHVFADDLGRWYYVNPATRVATLAGRTVHFFDHDFDGVWLEPGVDWWALAGARHANPCEKQIIVSDRRLTLSGLDPAANALTYAAEDLAPGLTDKARAGFVTLNDTRAFYGLPGCVLDLERSAHCRKHARWLILNKKHTHDEIPGTPGYSEEGHAAGKASLISNRTTPARSFFGIFDSPLHGYPLAAPYFTRTAVAHEDRLIVWWQEGVDFPMGPFDGKRVSVFPPHGATGIPVTWDSELPDPREGDRSYSWGYPIRIYLQKRFRARFIKITELETRLVPLGTDEEVPLQLKPDGEEFFVLPKDPLRPDTTYHFKMTWKERSRGPRELEITFETGKQAGQRRAALEK